MMLTITGGSAPGVPVILGIIGIITAVVQMCILMGRNAMGDLRVTVLPTQVPPLSNDAEFFPGLPKSWSFTFMVNDEAAPTGRPAWSIVPVQITLLSLAVAVWGYYWDVSWHIDRGRDEGAFANPAHWFIIIGLDGIAFAAILAMVLGDERHCWDEQRSHEGGGHRGTKRAHWLLLS